MIDARHIETLEKQPPGHAVLRALRMLMETDTHLMEVNANERSITFRFAMHLQRELPDWHVDCEYNRNGNIPKRLRGLPLTPNADDVDAKTVFPDVIVHRRNTEQNYLVMEFKKSNSLVERDVDLIKLDGYKRELGYEFALFIEIGISTPPYIHQIEWI